MSTADAARRLRRQRSRRDDPAAAEEPRTPSPASRPNNIPTSSIASAPASSSTTSNRAQIDQQLAWYANNPEYLERVFGRAESRTCTTSSQEIEARGMPLELALLPVVESAFEPYAYSWARANGLWQFIPGTGERFGLKQDWWYDGRRDVVESTRAALDYLQYMHDEFFGDWLLAVAAYNCGEFRVQREVNNNRAAGKPRRFLEPAACRPKRAPTCRSSWRCAASSRIPRTSASRSARFRTSPISRASRRGGQIDLTLAAELAGITLDELYELNPAFHRWATDPAGPHYLLLPRDTADAFKQNLDLLSHDERVRVSLHTVKSGESVASIAKKYKTQADRRARHEQPRRPAPLVVGSELRVPDRRRQSACQGHAGRRARRWPWRPQRRGVPRVHVVRSGDSLWRIAKRNRMDVATLARMNGMGTGDTLRAGQKLRAEHARARRGTKPLVVRAARAPGDATRCAAATRCRASRRCSA